LTFANAFDGGRSIAPFLQAAILGALKLEFGDDG